jgi:nucleotidyltransferase/DNA polymerase involved in DNA repair
VRRLTGAHDLLGGMEALGVPIEAAGRGRPAGQVVTDRSLEARLAGVHDLDPSSGDGQHGWP